MLGDDTLGSKLRDALRNLFLGRRRQAPRLANELGDLGFGVLAGAKLEDNARDRVQGVHPVGGSLIDDQPVVDFVRFEPIDLGRAFRAHAAAVPAFPPSTAARTSGPTTAGV